ncbi:hypothetical protein CANCADRAFT_29364 [Tortispora caseinolytica NRRL Y-17796]|uniref:DNA primase n=1 Tax=Tortispora caseinolytica NRRL Y-17796 TaxID=767744 RepID=A0A1E4TCF5_9ASCO|nr:hypothetical protein CANCADRAFT_29364 [Tortispora caseinolytica NRRL Y-17796]
MFQGSSNSQVNTNVQPKLPVAAVPAAVAPVTPATPAPVATFKPPPQDFESITSMYYKQLFPFRPVFQWLNHAPDPTPDFSKREIAMELHNGAYTRYRSYETPESFKKEVSFLNPARFEIGPVYSIDLINRAKYQKDSIQPVQKELIFDIDMTDYDEIRSCCSGTDICEKCWGFVRVAMHVIDFVLRHDFGFKFILWVFSGRRGVHAWISDYRARFLPDNARRSIVDYVNVFRGVSQGKLKLPRPLHPMLSHTLELLKSNFVSVVLQGQNPWGAPGAEKQLLSRLPNNGPFQQRLKQKWSEEPNRSSLDKWKDIDEIAKSKDLKTLDRNALLEAKQDIMFYYLAPRLDENVSTKLNHLLKSPFCIHPKTQKICVPIPTDQIDTFDPSSVPIATELLKEVQGKRVTENTYESTTLRPYVDYFRKFYNEQHKAERSLKRSRESEGLDF